MHNTSVLAPDDDGSFAATLSPRQKRLAGRLEGFGDIVFGFAVSQCALQLPIVEGHVDITHPVALLLYFGTYAILASLWLIYHRMLSGTFKPGAGDLFISFGYLALVSLIPYAMYEITHNITSAASAQSALLGYLSLYSSMMGLSAILAFRNIRRGYFFSTEDDRNHAWLVFLRQVVLFVMMSGGLAIDYTLGATASGIFLLFIVVAIRLMRKLFPRMPAAARLGIKARLG